MSIPSSGSSTERSTSRTSSRVGMGTRVPRQAVLRELFSLEQPKLLTRNAALREAESARVLAAERAMAMVCAPEGQLDLEAHAAAEAAPRERHQKPSSRTSSRRSRAKK